MAFIAFMAGASSAAFFMALRFMAFFIAFIAFMAVASSAAFFMALRFMAFFIAFMAFMAGGWCLLRSLLHGPALHGLLHRLHGLHGFHGFHRRHDEEDGGRWRMW